MCTGCVLDGSLLLKRLHRLGERQYYVFLLLGREERCQANDVGNL